MQLDESVLLWLPFNTDFEDNSTYERTLSLYKASNSFPQSTSRITNTKFSCGNGAAEFFYGEENGGLHGFANLVYVYDTIPAFDGDFCIQFWASVAHESLSPKALISSSDILDEFIYGPSVGGWMVKFQGETGSRFLWNDGVTEINQTQIVIDLPAGNDPVRIAIFRKDGVIYSAANGIVYEDSVSYSDPIGGNFPISVGGSRRSSPAGHDYLTTGDCLDEIVISNIAVYNPTNFVHPSCPIYRFEWEKCARPFIPDEQGYTFTLASETKHIELEGGSGRYRRDFIGANTRIPTNWKFRKDEYGAFLDMWKVAGKNPVSLPLILDGASLANYYVHLIPGTLQLTGQIGLTYYVSCELEVAPLSFSTDWPTL